MLKKKLRYVLISIPLFFSPVTLKCQQINEPFVVRLKESESVKIKYEGNRIIKKGEEYKAKKAKEARNKKIEEEAKKRLDKWEKKHKQEQLFGRGTEVHETKITVTFYCAIDDDINGGGITCHEVPARYGIVASNVYPQGTKIYLPSIDKNRCFVVADKGGSDFDRYDRLDLFIERLPGEDDETYKKRAYSLGIRNNIQAYVISNN